MLQLRVCTVPTVTKYVILCGKVSVINASDYEIYFCPTPIFFLPFFMSECSELST